MSTPFIYVNGDKTKSPVKPSEQKPGTLLVFVDKMGRETPFNAGKLIVADPAKRLATWKKRLKDNTPEGALSPSDWLGR
jgi:hypothetical protein